jgi:hypothetical protein
VPGVIIQQDISQNIQNSDLLQPQNGEKIQKIYVILHQA